MNIKPGFEEKYKSYVEKNSKESYSKAVVDAGEAVGKLLDEGQTPEEAQQALYDRGLTRWMAGAAMTSVCRFNPRGEEMRKWWNSSFGQENAVGVFNPINCKTK